MAESFAAYLLVTQILMHLAIAVRLMAFNSEGRTHRPWVARLAFLLAASSAATALHSAMSFQHQLAGPTDYWQTLFVGIVLVAIFKARGNLAYFLPR